MEKLSKEAMKKVMGGMNAPADCSLSACTSDAECAGPNGSRICKSIECVYDNGINSTYNICVSNPGY